MISAADGYARAHGPRPGITRRRLRRAAAGALLAAWAQAGAGEGIAALDRVVRDACECAADQPSGLDAALRCADGPRAFGRLKVGARDDFDDAARARAANLERVIETCIANALDYHQAHVRLGIAPAAGGAPQLARWRRLGPGELTADATRLVRIERGAGAPLKGVVEEVSGGSLQLRLARSDGGGRERIALDAILRAWVLELPDP